MRRSFSLLLITIELLSYTLSNCLVDECLTCPNPTIQLCIECKQGYYIKIFHRIDDDKEYHDCWSSIKTGFILIFLLIIAIGVCIVFYVAYRQGVKYGANEKMIIIQAKKDGFNEETVQRIPKTIARDGARSPGRDVYSPGRHFECIQSISQNHHNQSQHSYEAHSNLPITEPVAGTDTIHGRVEEQKFYLPKSIFKDASESKMRK